MIRHDVDWGVASTASFNLAPLLTSSAFLNAFLNAGTAFWRQKEQLLSIIAEHRLIMHHLLLLKLILALDSFQVVLIQTNCLFFTHPRKLAFIVLSIRFIFLRINNLAILSVLSDFILVFVNLV